MDYDEPGDQLERWKRGRTGFPIVDAGMRQLRATGWMHNRVRMIVASFLVKDLHVEWQHGARHFMQLAGRRRPGLQPARLAVDRRAAAPTPRRTSGSSTRSPRAGSSTRTAATSAAGCPSSPTPPTRTQPVDPIVDHAEERREALERWERIRSDDRARCVPRRFCGPASSGNGGWTAGALAGLLDHDARRPRRGLADRTVTLRRPPPLDVPLPVSDGVAPPPTARWWPRPPRSSTATLAAGRAGRRRRRRPAAERRTPG